MNPKCHPDKKLAAKGLCYPCYTAWRKENCKRAWACPHTDRYVKAHGLCKSCYNTSQRRIDDRRWRWRASDLKRHYGMTVEDYQTLYDRQGGVCAICAGLSQRNFRLSVDHDHRTGKIRGLLCERCNVAIIGLDRGDGFMNAAVAYLQAAQ